MNPKQLKVVFRRVLLGATAGPLALSGCGGSNCHPMPVNETVVLIDGGLPQGYPASSCSSFDFDAGTAQCMVTPLCLGREPAGLLAVELGGAELADCLARMAWLEAASVVAFRQLAGELRALAAPRELVDSALASARDEVRHARAVGVLARKRGATPLRVRVSARASRDAFELALDNAAEGCGRESFGALVGLYQAEHAADSEVKALLAELADDEVRHSAFSLELARHLDTRLTDAQRAEVRRAKDTALEALVAQASAWEQLPYRDALGLPSRQTVRALAGGFQAAMADA